MITWFSTVSVRFWDWIRSLEETRRAFLAIGLIAVPATVMQVPALVLIPVVFGVLLELVCMLWLVLLMTSIWFDERNDRFANWSSCDNDY